MMSLCSLQWLPFWLRVLSFSLPRLPSFQQSFVQVALSCEQVEAPFWAFLLHRIPPNRP